MTWEESKCESTPEEYSGRCQKSAMIVAQSSPPTVPIYSILYRFVWSDIKHTLDLRLWATILGNGWCWIEMKRLEKWRQSVIAGKYWDVSSWRDFAVLLITASAADSATICPTIIRPGLQTHIRSSWKISSLRHDWMSLGTCDYVAILLLLLLLQ